MLTEQNRQDLVNDLNDNVTFKYQSFEPTMSVMRHREGIREKFPYVTVEFLPANRTRFRSISDIIGKATESGQYKQYGYCQLEQVNIYCYCGERHNKDTLNGRLLTYAIADAIRLWVLRNWEQLLYKMYASFDRSDDFNMIKDLSYYNIDTESWIYCYGLSFMLRTQVRWDKIPTDFEEEDIIEKVGLYIKTTSEDEYELIKQIDVSDD